MSLIIRTKQGHPVPTVSTEQLRSLREEQVSSYHISPSRMVEASAFSLAMVVRYALGLTAEGGAIGALVRDCVAGQVALAAARHLLNGGASTVQVVVLSEQAPGATTHEHSLSEETAAQIKILEKLGASIYDYQPSDDNGDFEQLLKSCHNLLVGTFSPIALPSDAHLGALAAILNELPTPAHCVDLPYGVDPNTGAASPEAMYASSTTSLGIPLSGCLAGHDHLGRHYVADCCFSLAQYRALGQEGPALFGDQPVIQLVHE